MFKINGMHSNNIVLRHYCGVDRNLPIWGEVQHSLWETKNFRTHRESRLFPRLFTWNNILKFTNQVAIGDPYLYLKNEIFSNQTQLTLEANSVLVIPKFRRLLSMSERISVYIRILNETQGIFPNFPKILVLHAEENILEISKFLSLDPDVWKIIDRSPKNTIYGIKGEIQRLAQAEILVTDYLGVHIMRRLAITGQESILLENLKSWRGVDLEISEFLEVLASPIAKVHEKLEVSKLLLGDNFLREREELSKVLGFTGFKKMFGPKIMGLYHKKVGSYVHGVE